MTDEEKTIYENAKRDYPNEDEAFYLKHVADAMYWRNKWRNEKEREQREITSSTYERAERRLHKKVDDWFKR